MSKRIPRILVPDEMEGLYLIKNTWSYAKKLLACFRAG